MYCKMNIIKKFVKTYSVYSRHNAAALWHGGAIRQSKPTRSRHTALMNLFPKFRRMRRDTIITGCCYNAGALLFRGERRNFAHQISDLSCFGTQKSVLKLIFCSTRYAFSVLFSQMFLNFFQDFRQKVLLLLLFRTHANSGRGFNAKIIFSLYFVYF